MYRSLAVLLTMSMIPILGATPISKDQDQAKEKSMLDRLMHFYSWNDPKAPKMPYQGKEFRGSGQFSGKTFATKEYAGTKEFGAKSYATKSYSDSGKGWFSKLFPSKKLPDSLQGTSRDASKSFETGKFATKGYEQASQGDPYKGRQEFETRQISLKGKTQGAIDNDPKLQEAVRKGLSIDDVKRLLNNPGTPSQ